MTSGAGPVVQLKHVTVCRSGVVVLDDINLSVNKADFCAIIGPNGAGKTTLLKVILGLVEPKSGEVLVFGKPPRELGAQKAKIGYVPQVSSIDLRFPISVFETVLMGTFARLGVGARPRSADYQAARAALERLGIAELADKPIGRLSAGQRQRVFIARALVNNPELLLLDEPTTGVDTAVTAGFYTLLRQLKETGITVILVSHDIGVVASYVDSVACLNRSLFAHCRPDEVQCTEALRAMYGCDVAYLHHGEAPHIVVEEHE
ncbi:MAG: metal ABC transporter ATP-binding protein [Armatimonadota bacterium]|nr:metal ABC transporter ATP-binding protein [Armatimonadota bacterium]